MQSYEAVSWVDAVGRSHQNELSYAIKDLFHRSLSDPGEWTTEYQLAGACYYALPKGKRGEAGAYLRRQLRLLRPPSGRPLGAWGQWIQKVLRGNRPEPEPMVIDLSSRK